MDLAAAASSRLVYFLGVKPLVRQLKGLRSRPLSRVLVGQRDLGWFSRELLWSCWLRLVPGGTTVETGSCGKTLGPVEAVNQLHSSISTAGAATAGGVGRQG